MGSPVTNIAASPQQGIFSSEMVRLHDVAPAFRTLRVSGLRSYIERCVLLPGVAAIQTELPADYVSYLASVGIGSNATLRANPADSLIAGFGPDDHKTLNSMAQDGFSFEFFLPTEREQDFVAQTLGLDYTGHVWNADPAFAKLVNDKVWLREQFAGHSKISAQFPEHQLVDVENWLAIFDATEDLVSRYGGAILKPRDLASGDGMIRIHDRPNWQQKLHEGLKRLIERGIRGPIIVEAAYWDHVPLSAQLQLTASGPQYLQATEQLITDGTVHAGNIITNGELPGTDAWIRKQMELQSLEVAQVLWDRGYRGYLGFDFILAGGQLFLIEANGRVTGAAYPLSVGLQVQANGAPKWGIVTDNVHPHEPLTYELLTRKLRGEGMLFDGTKGVLPVAPGLLTVGKAMTYCIGRDVKAAHEYLVEVRELLAPGS